MGQKKRDLQCMHTSMRNGQHKNQGLQCMAGIGEEVTVEHRHVCYHCICLEKLNLAIKHISEQIFPLSTHQCEINFKKHV